MADCRWCWELIRKKELGVDQPADDPSRIVDLDKECREWVVCIMLGWIS